MASFCASSETPSPCFWVDTRMYPKQEFIHWYWGSLTLPYRRILATPVRLALARCHPPACANRCGGKGRDGVANVYRDPCPKGTGPICAAKTRAHAGEA